MKTWTIGSFGFNAGQVFCGTEAVCIVYGIPLHTSVEKLLEPQAIEKFAQPLQRAALIAAAPSMLKALETARSALRLNPDNCQDEINTATREIDSAIEKATNIIIALGGRSEKR